MDRQRPVLELLAVSGDPALQLRAAIGAHEDAEHHVIVELCTNPELHPDVVEWLIARWVDQPDAAAVAGRHIADITSPALRSALDTADAPVPAAALCGAGWVSTATLVEVITGCGEGELAEVVAELADSYLRGGARDVERATAVASAMWDRWEHWYLEGRHTGWAPIAHLLGPISDALRGTGRQWFTPPPPGCGGFGLAAWWEDLTPFASAAHLVGTLDVLRHPHCAPELAARVLESICEYTTGAGGSLTTFIAAATAHAAAHPTVGPRTVAAVAATLVDGGDEHDAAQLAAELTERIGDNFCAEIDCVTALNLALHHLHRHSFRSRLVRILTERCGEDTEAAISLLAGGFSGTVAELCDVITTGDVTLGGAQLTDPANLRTRASANRAPADPST